MPIRVIALLAVAPLILSPAQAASDQCLALTPPVGGPAVDAYAPIGDYAGHWGVDLAADVGSPVLAPWFGTVTFAGTVDENVAVTIDHGGGLLSSLSYLRELTVTVGQVVAAGEQVAVSGVAHGRPSVHLSVRVGGTYVDPAPLLDCSPVPISEALRLAG